MTDPLGVSVNKYREKFRRVFEGLGYAALSIFKDVGLFRHNTASPFFGIIRRGRSTAAFMKAHRLADLFGNSPLCNSILYVCSGNIPIGYCLREKKRGVKLIVNQNGVYYQGWYGDGYEEANRRHLLGYYRAADYIIYQSAFCEESARRFLGKPSCPHEILYNPVDTAFFTPDKERIFDPVAPVFLATGIFYSEVKEERIRLMLESFTLVHSQLPKARLIIAGYFAPHLAEVADRAGEGVYFIGPYKYEQAPALYMQGDIYLNTQFNDNCPSAVLEAMSCGLPVVHLNCGGTPELTGEAGISVPVEQSWEKFLYPEPEVYATAMLEAVQHREGLSSAARQRCVERFDIQIWKKRHEEIFRIVST